MSSISYLIAILRRQQVAQVCGKPIYVITSVAFIPLSSQLEAEKAIGQANGNLARQSEDDKAGDSDSSDDEDHGVIDAHSSPLGDDDLTLPTTPEPVINSRPGTPQSAHKRNTSIVEDVIEKKGQYGRFADKWFSKKGWTIERRRTLGMSTADPPKSESTHETRKDGAQPEDSASSEVKPSDEGVTLSSIGRRPEEEGSGTVDNVAKSLLPKLVKTTKMMLGSRSFYFSYDYDVTRRLGDQDERSSHIPLHRKVDPLVCYITTNVLRDDLAYQEQFFWNRHLMEPFIDSGLHQFVLPLMQGFVGQRTFIVNPSDNSKSRVEDSQGESGTVIELKDVGTNVEVGTAPSDKRDFLLTLISRRSIKRPGLRYLRRGVDDNGDVANSVETEQILSSQSWLRTDRIYSFLQIRGSIPLYFSQSPYSFKPAPVLQHSQDTNHTAFKRHVSNIAGRYGNAQMVSLVNKHGVEAKIGEEYQKHVEQLNEEGGVNGTRVDFEWFDFHAICRGMKFENVSVLMETLGDKLDEFGATIEVDGQVQKKQQGVLRTNCMDCLDRTNVVQSACGQRALEQHLREEGFPISLQTDKTTQWFNSLWADNGDAISKQYSSTAALKGDYTRTRKRDYRGAINDFGLTISRYFNNIVNDYFSQAAIDFLLGNVTSQVFDEFEADMMSRDPAVSMRKVRQNAIDASSKIVIADTSEDLIGGWTLLCPQESSSLRTFPFEEAVLLLTDAALYAVRFDWNMEKVSAFERVDLRSVLGIQYGTYITSTLAATQMDEKRNVGFVVRYRPGKEDVVRVNTRSLNNALPDHDHGREGGKNEVSRDVNPDAVAPSSSNFQGTLDGSSDSKLSSKSNRNTFPRPSPTTTKILAFKALPAQSSTLARSSRNSDDNGGGTDSPPVVVVGELDLVRSICEDIQRACLNDDVGAAEKDQDKQKGMIEEKEIIGLAEAKKSTGLLEVWGHELKKLVWA